MTKHSNTHADLKQLILMSWKDRWSEKEWSMHARTYLHTPSDVFHVADALVSQAFIGTAPNSLLVEYIWYGIDTGLFSYASVITAISKHDDLHKVDSTRELYKLLSKCLTVINGCALVEDSMDLCCSLRMILQWLLTNTETYLKDSSYGSTTAAEELLQLNCEILKQLATGLRTSVLLTIARFEESGVWSHIETDLAVIKTSAGQHPLHAQITDSCHSVSQLSRCSIMPRAVRTVKTNHTVSLPITTLLLLEVRCRKCSEAEGIASQLSLLGQIHGLSTADLLVQILRSCSLGFLEAVESESIAKLEWGAMVVLRIPKILSHLKSMKQNDLSNAGGAQHGGKFELALIEALTRLKTMDSLIDSLDQLRSDMSWIKILSEVFVQRQLIDRSNVEHLLQPRPSNKQHYETEKCKNPMLFLKAERNIESYIATLNPASFTSDPERLLKTFQLSCSFIKFNIFLPVVAAADQLSALANQLCQVNDALKSSSAESGKTAQMRAALFDMSFLMVCYMIKLYGKEKVLSSGMSNSSDCVLRRWIDVWWGESGKFNNSVPPQADANKVERLIQLLRNSSEIQLNQTDWGDMCSALPQAVLEFAKAKQHGLISASDLNRVCCAIRDTCLLSASLAVLAALARSTRLTSSSFDFPAVFQVIVEKSQSQSIPLYDERFFLFEKVAEHLFDDFQPKQATPSDPCRMSLSRPAAKILQEAITESIENGYVNSSCLDKFKYAYKYLGVAALTLQFTKPMLQGPPRLAYLETMVELAYSVFQIDLLSFTIYMLKHGLQSHFMAVPYALSEPVGPLLAELMVACLDFALNDRLLQQKALLPLQNVSPFLHELSPERKRDGSMQVRRLLSCSTEHDLSSSNGNAELSPDDPLLLVFSDFIQKLWDHVLVKKTTVFRDFAFTFVRHCLYSTSLLSRSTKKVLPVAMVKDFSSLLIRDSKELLFAACDLGNPDIRRVAADAIIHVEAEQISS